MLDLKSQFSEGRAEVKEVWDSGGVAPESGGICKPS